MKRSLMTFAAVSVMALPALADGHRNAAPDDARAYIVSPATGDTVSNPVTIVLDLRGWASLRRM